MDSNQIDENVVEIERYLRKIDYTIRRKGREILNDFNITVPQFTALQILIYNNGGMTIGELSTKMDLACSTITDLIDRMEKSELVIRERDTKDKRVVNIIVLDKGLNVLKQVLEKRREYLARKLEGFSMEEKELLSRGLQSLNQGMSKE